MVCNLPVMKTLAEKRENPDCGVSCGGCRKQKMAFGPHAVLSWAVGSSENLTCEARSQALM